jgi:predicted enzyme related to lactoylglutathione lyase
MITGIHALIYADDATKVREFFRNVLGLPSVDAGDGWLIFALPPAELGIHPTNGPGHHELYLMCDDIEETVEDLTGRGVDFAGPISDEGFGLVARARVPGGGELAVYEPRHPTALGLTS